jgi:hypothetical protein
MLDLRLAYRGIGGNLLGGAAACNCPASLAFQLRNDFFLANYGKVQKKSNPLFFLGKLKDPHTIARCLLVLSNVVHFSLYSNLLLV